jgi:hypothetical protein
MTKNRRVTLDKLIFNRIYSLFSFIREMKHLSISHWEVEQQKSSTSYQTTRQQKVAK